MPNLRYGVAAVALLLAGCMSTTDIGTRMADSDFRVETFRTKWTFNGRTVSQRATELKIAFYSYEKDGKLALCGSFFAPHDGPDIKKTYKRYAGAMRVWHNDDPIAKADFMPLIVAEVNSPLETKCVETNTAWSPAYTVRNLRLIGGVYR